MRGDAVARIDREARRVTTESGLSVAWDTLVLATGSYAARLTVDGFDLTGCFVYRTLDDVEGLRAFVERRTARTRPSPARHGHRRRPARSRGGRRPAGPGRRVHRRAVLGPAHVGAARRPRRGLAAPAHPVARHRRAHRQRHHAARSRHPRQRARPRIPRGRLRRHGRRRLHRRSAAARPARARRRAEGRPPRRRHHRRRMHDLRPPHPRDRRGRELRRALRRARRPRVRDGRGRGDPSPRIARRPSPATTTPTKLKLNGVDVASFGDAFAPDARCARCRLRRPGGGRLQEARALGRRADPAGRHPRRRCERLRDAASPRRRPARRRPRRLPHARGRRRCAGERRAARRGARVLVQQRHGRDDPLRRDRRRLHGRRRRQGVHPRRGRVRIVPAAGQEARRHRARPQRREPQHRTVRALRALARPAVRCRPRIGAAHIQRDHRALRHRPRLRHLQAGRSPASCPPSATDTCSTARTPPCRTRTTT